MFVYLLIGQSLASSTSTLRSARLILLIKPGRRSCASSSLVLTTTSAPRYFDNYNTINNEISHFMA